MVENPDRALIYEPGVFLRGSIQEAMQIILTRECGQTTDERWVRETAWLRPFLTFEPGVVLDYGCGIGRLAKNINNPVLGADISQTMRAHADEYVARSEFGSVNPLMLEKLVDAGLRCSGAIAAWVLQHAFHPDWDIDLIARALVPGARFLVLNRSNRVVPVRVSDAPGQAGWYNDGLDIAKMLQPQFSLRQLIAVPPGLCDPGSYLGIYEKRP